MNVVRGYTRWRCGGTKANEPVNVRAHVRTKHKTEDQTRTGMARVHQLFSAPVPSVLFVTLPTEDKSRE